ncbi:MAG: hypothetical protein BWY83_01116 [bacterium ADurb.Bin478]|nr:MAG: hypothetical protein BWY83_01116 [bacterium ADurb.Bin478]
MSTPAVGHHRLQISRIGRFDERPGNGDKLPFTVPRSHGSGIGVAEGIHAHNGFTLNADIGAVYILAVDRAVFAAGAQPQRILATFGAFDPEGDALRARGIQVIGIAGGVIALNVDPETGIGHTDHVYFNAIGAHGSRFFGSPHLSAVRRGYAGHDVIVHADTRYYAVGVGSGLALAEIIGRCVRSNRVVAVKSDGIVIAVDLDFGHAGENRQGQRQAQ